ncbi:mucin-1-like [Papaver somniferum]|uniref:mucin-1-like n=1 Tax=Papaver somniferum TaxID=3469 RepID=UPI000E6F6391|nr:mucin-1-like [Papaver somniferum]
MSVTGSEICKPGDIYDVVLCSPTENCACCTGWCGGRCASMGCSVSDQTCEPFMNPSGSPNLRCDCCCKPPSSPSPSPFPSPSPDSSPSPSPYSSPPSPSPPTLSCLPKFKIQLPGMPEPCKYTLSSTSSSLSSKTAYAASLLNVT